MNAVVMDERKRKVLGSLWGVAVGDALGMPFESLTANRVAEILGDGNLGAGYLPPTINEKAQWLESLQAGDYTDDTILTLAVMRALVEANGAINMELMVTAHIEAMDKSPVAWGLVTTGAIKRLKEGVSYKESGDPNGWSNGFLMKTAPIGLARGMCQKAYNALEDENIVSLGAMTHLSLSAVTAGCVHAYAISTLLQLGKNPDFLPTLRCLAELMENQLVYEGGFKPETHKISDQIYLIEKMEKSGELESLTPEELSKRFQTQMYSSHAALLSFGLCYALFWRNPESFTPVYEAILAGGDTDTNASIVGSLVGALNGVDVIPRNLINDIRNCTELQSAFESFYEKVKLA